MQTGVATMENSMELPQKVTDGTALWPSTSTSGTISKENKNANSKEYMHLYVYCNIIYNRQDLETAQVPNSGWVGKKAVVHLHNGTLVGHKKEGNLTFCNSRMDLKFIMLMK